MSKPSRISKYNLIPQGSRAIVCEGNIRLGLVDSVKLETYVKNAGRKVAADEDVQWALKHALLARYRIFHKPLSSRELETAAAIDD
ncbi:MAG TPA: hypothetical protein VN709_10295 [Terriglobales bacterium]|jgi:hypothetical protein|nr:hypothetical protein [Terriglobales bacterium]